MAKNNDSPKLDTVQEVTVNGEVTTRLVGDDDHEHGTYGIELYDAEGAYVGHAEVSDGFVYSVTEMVQSQALNTSPTLASTEIQISEKLDNITTIGVVLVVALFMCLGAVSILTLVRSLRLK